MAVAKTRFITQPCWRGRNAHVTAENQTLYSATTPELGATSALDRSVEFRALPQADADLRLFLVPLDDDRRWYRYHRLFADLLRYRLDRLLSGRVPALHLRACEWYAQNGMAYEAMGHALAAGDFERAARLVEETDPATMVMRGEAAAFYQQRAGMLQRAAYSEAVKNSLFPGGVMMYLIGTDRIKQLRAEMAQRWGRFHDEFLSYGSIPVALIAKEMERKTTRGIV